MSDADQPAELRRARELLLQALLDEEEERRRGTPPKGAERRREWNLMRRFRPVFETAGALVLGLLLASFIVLVIFLVTRLIFHIDLSRFFPF